MTKIFIRIFVVTGVLNLAMFAVNLVKYHDSITYERSVYGFLGYLLLTAVCSAILTFGVFLINKFRQ